jgi:hypothetical protein
MEQSSFREADTNQQIKNPLPLFVEQDGGTLFL